MRNDVAKVVVNKKREGGVRVGQVRRSRRKNDRFILVINDVRAPEGGAKSVFDFKRVLRALTLKEGERGTSEPFNTIPREYTEEELERDFPIILETEISIKSQI